MFTRFLLGVIRARKLVFVLAAVWAALGIWITLHTSIDALPDISENQVLVYTPWPNHNPPEIHDAITGPLSESLKNIPGVISVRGTSDVGFSLLYLIFDPSIDYSIARKRVAAQVAHSQVHLPEGLQPDIAAESVPTGQIVWYTLSGRDTDLLELRNWQDQFVAPRLREVSGVAEVASVGGFTAEVQIDVDSNALAAAGVSIGEFGQLVAREVLTPVSKVQRASSELAQIVNALEDIPLQISTAKQLRLGDVCRATLQPAPRYGVFEQDGNEVVGGVIHLKAGENPLRITQLVMTAMQRIGDELPRGMRLTPCYDRMRLISGAVSTVTRTLLEALLVTTICILLIMRHFRTSLVITLTLPLAVLGAFVGMQVLRFAGANIHVNIMSLAGVAISIGVLVDASVVIVENVTFNLKREFGDQPVTGDTDQLVATATALVARPAVLAVLIMLVSFLPVFALGGIEGQLIRPLAWTKTLTLISVIILTLTLVPALSRQLIRGQLRSEQDSQFLRSVIRIYKPVLSAVCQGSWLFVLLLGSLMILAAAATGNSLGLRIVVVVVVGCVWLTATAWASRIGLTAGAIGLALTAHSSMRPIGLALRLPLDEGMVMDMPISLPRMTVRQATDDLKARNMILCRFPEVQMVTGKAGRAETAFDPAPIDMIESMVEFRRLECWPRRRLLPQDARRQAAAVVRQMIAAQLVEAAHQESQLVDSIVASGLLRFDAIQREVCWHLLQAYEQRLARELTEICARELALIHAKQTPLAMRPDAAQIQAFAGAIDSQDRIHLARQLDATWVHIVSRELTRAMNPTETGLRDNDPSRILKRIQTHAAQSWRNFVQAENQVLYRRAGATWTQIVVDELCAHQALLDADFTLTRNQIAAARYAGADRAAVHHADQHAGLPSFSELPLIDPHAVYERIIRESTQRFDREVWLWVHDQGSLTGMSGELDAAVQMPGWANVWTRPIQNRIDMLSTGVSSEVGVRVLGEDFAKVVTASEQIAEVLQHIPGAADVIADPIRGKDYLDVDLQNERLVAQQLDRAEVELSVQAVTTGYLITPARNDSAIPVRLKIQPAAHRQADNLLDTPLALRVNPPTVDGSSAATQVQLLAFRDLAHIRHRDGPATIKSYNGQLCNYVRLNVRGRDASRWVQEAQSVLRNTALPSGISLQWTGQFEHAARTRASLLWMVPVCLAIIGFILLFTFRDVADALLMLLSIPGALAGAILTQWILGYPFSLAVGIGYLACFGMAAATSIVMIIYLRKSLEDAGGLQQVASLEELRSCVIAGAVHRLRPKLLTEATMIFSLAPLLWSTGVGADVIRPMAAPVLGGILVADEVVDLLIPAMFFAVRRRRWLRQRPQ